MDEAMCKVTHLIQLHSVGPCPVGRVTMEVEDDCLSIISDEALMIMVMVSACLEIVGGREDVPHTHLDVLVDIDIEILSVG